MFEPSDDELEPVEIEVARTPDYTMSDDEVASTDFQYSIRGPDDWVSSGPLGVLGAGPGRRFATWKSAEVWAREFYGKRFRGRIPEAAIEGHNRWAFLIRGPRGAMK